MICWEFGRVGRKDLQPSEVNMTGIVNNVVNDLVRGIRSGKLM